MSFPVKFVTPVLSASGLVLSAQLYDANDAAYGAPILSGFAELPTLKRIYVWRGTIPDGFDGSVLFTDTDSGEVVAVGVIDPSNQPLPTPTGTVTASAPAAVFRLSLFRGEDKTFVVTLMPARDFTTATLRFSVAKEVGLPAVLTRAVSGDAQSRVSLPFVAGDTAGGPLGVGRWMCQVVNTAGGVNAVVGVGSLDVVDRVR